MARRNRLAVATEAASEEPRTGGALALEQRVDDVDDGPGIGPYDGDDLDPEATDAVGIVDFGAVRVPVPARGTVAVEPTANGRMQAVHVALPEGRLSVSALAAPKSSRLWPDLAREIDTSLREGGATVRSFPGPWGRELHANSGAAKSVFIGVDGPRWMLYGVATGPANHADMLDAELRRMLRATVVVRGRAPYPVRTVLPLVVPEHLAAAMAAAAAAKAEADAEAEALSAELAAPAPSGADPAPFGAPELPPAGRAPASPPTEQPGPVRPAPRPRPGPAPREVPAAPVRDSTGYAQPPDTEVGAPLWADPVRRVADAGQESAARPGPADFDDAPTEVWGVLPPDPAGQLVGDSEATGAWQPVGEPDQVQAPGGHRLGDERVPGGFPTQPWPFDPRLTDGPESWVTRPAQADPVRGRALDSGAGDAPTDPWPLADRFRVEPMADAAESPWSPVRHAGDAVTSTGGRRRLAEPEQSRPDPWGDAVADDPVPSNGAHWVPDEDHLPETGEYSVPAEYAEHSAPSGHDVRSEYAEPAYEDSPCYGVSGSGAWSGYGGAAGYPAAAQAGGRRRAHEVSDDAPGDERQADAEPLTQEFSFELPPADIEPVTPAQEEAPRAGRGRHAAPETGDVAPETSPLQVFVPPATSARPAGRHRRSDEEA